MLGRVTAILACATGIGFAASAGCSQAPPGESAGIGGNSAQDEKVGGPVHGVVFKGRRYDTGDRGDYLRAIVRLACEREDLGPDFRVRQAPRVRERCGERDVPSWKVPAESETSSPGC